LGEPLPRQAIDQVHLISQLIGWMQAKLESVSASYAGEAEGGFRGGIATVQSCSKEV